MKKFLKIMLCIMGSLLAVIVAFWFSISYTVNYKKTTCDTSVSPDGKYELTLQAVGEPDWPFGSASGRLVLKEGEDKISQTDFELHNDGASISSSCWKVTWHEDYVEIILSGEEQFDEQVILYFDGTKEIQQLTDVADIEVEYPSGERLDESRVITEQSFEVDLNDWGEVRFVSYLPTYDTLWEDVSFVLAKDNQIIYYFPECYENNSTENDSVGMFDSVEAVGFQDIDGVTYSFDENGYIQTGWVEKGVKDYYFNEDGSYDPSKVRPMLALTFDDGPGEYTDELLDCLEQNNAHATFFMLGQNVSSYPDAPKRMLELGCEIGSHSWDHTQLTTIDLDAVAKQFSDTDDALIQACGQAASVARAPYGDGNSDIYNTVNKPFFMWSLDTEDWKLLDADADYSAVMNGDLTDGTIILMHDIHEPSVKAALRLIPDLIAQGYKLVTVSEMAEAKNVTLQNACYVDFWPSTLSNGDVPGYQGGSDAAASADGTDGTSDASADSSDGSTDSSDGSEDYSDGSSDDGSYDDGSSDDGSYDDGSSDDSEDYSDDSVDYGDGTE